MVKRDIVVIGGSAGSIEALTVIVKDLPADLQVAIFVVVHISPHSPGYLAEILTGRGALPAKYPDDGEQFSPGMIYIAPPDHHLIVDPPATARVFRGPRENGTRPAVDPLFRSAALGFGRRVVGIVLSGALDDGAAGMRGISMCGGTTVVQDPADALQGSMPRSAMRGVRIDYCKPAAELAPLIVQLAAAGAPDRFNGDDKMRKELEFEVALAKGETGDITSLGDPSLFTCPECHGALVKLRSEHPLRFRCHTGHAFTADSLLADMSEVTEEAIWNTIRSIQESSMLMTHLAQHWQGIDPKVAEEFLSQAKDAQDRARLVRQVASEHQALSRQKVERGIR